MGPSFYVDQARETGFAKARQHWPSIKLTLEQFSQHLENLGWVERVPLHVESLYLCIACGLGSELACRRFDGIYFPSLRAAMQRHYRRWDFVEEVLQRTRERLLVGPPPRIATYRGDGSLAAWLLRIAHRVASDLHRSEASRRRATFAELKHSVVEAQLPHPDMSLLNTNTELACVDCMERATINAAISIGSENRSMLYMFYVQQLDADQIARCLDLDRSTVYRRLNALKLRIAQHVSEALKKQTGIYSRAEIDELLRVGYQRMSLDAEIWQMGCGPSLVAMGGV